MPKYAAPICGKYWWSEHSGRLNVLHLTEKKNIFIYLLFGNDFASTVRAVFLPSCISAMFLRQQSRDEILIYFSCSSLSHSPPETHNSCHLYWQYITKWRATHNSFYTKPKRAPNGALAMGNEVSEWERNVCNLADGKHVPKRTLVYEKNHLLGIDKCH